jgi:hypothetical protein
LAKNFPKDYFGSYEEYETYFTCLSKAQPGDKALIYIVEDGLPPQARPEYHRTDLTREVVIIGRKFDGKHHDKFSQTLLLGSNDDSIGFWSLSLAEQKYISPLMIHFKYGYYAYIDEVRIARIIKA